MLKSALLLTILGAASAAQSQQGTVPPLSFPVPAIRLPAPRALPARELPEPCPVSLAAQPGGQPGAVFADAADDAVLLRRSRTKTGVHVRVTSGARPMREVTIAVSYGVLPEGFTPAGWQPDLVGSKKFVLPAGTDVVIDRNLRIEGVVRVKSIRVLAVKFADGGEWTAGLSNRCTVRPSPLVLVGRR